MIGGTRKFMKEISRSVYTGGSKFGRSQHLLMGTFDETEKAAVPTTDHTFYQRDLHVKRATGNEMKAKPVECDNIIFGHQYSDHMMEVEWTAEEGWTKPCIRPLHNLSLHPGVKSLHYAIQLFEGLKAFRGIDGQIRLFRPEFNMQRMIRTAARACLPVFDGEELIKLIKDLIRVDREWVPYSTTSALYIRPTMIATDPTLGVKDPTSALLFVLTGPVGKYFQTGFQPVSLLADPEFVRAFPGGCGAYKMGCNYAPTILIGKRAAEVGCQQVVWLYGYDEKLTEVGTMNIFVFWCNEQGETELVTPPLDEGLILPGVTRRCLLELSREWNEFKVTEKYVTMNEIRKAINEKRLMEIFGAGTACIVSPVGHILYKNHSKGCYEDLYIPTMDNKPNLMQRFYQTITDIQYGRTEKAGWTNLVI